LQLLSGIARCYQLFAALFSLEDFMLKNGVLRQENRVDCSKIFMFVQSARLNLRRGTPRDHTGKKKKSV